VCNGVKFVSFDLDKTDAQFGKTWDCPLCYAPEVSAQRNAKMIHQSNLLDDAIGLSIDHIIERGMGSRRMVAEARRMLTKPFGMLTIWGGPGNGKSLLLKILVNEFIQRGVSAAYMDMSDLLDYLRDGFQEGAKAGFAERLATVQQMGFLAIDEMDKINRTGWVEEQVFRLLNARYNDGRAGRRYTAMAMNKNPEEWMNDYAISRIRYDMHGPDGFRIIENTDEDARESGL
jgi:DNA replication protein DnaC